ncbi:hypothetical protein C0J52_04767 [Blattella germanica]|nr:hypothetical protein C0J52_04767 [Blattella germanica]
MHKLESTKPHLFLWIIALKAKPSRHEAVKSVTLTPGYLAVERLAHLNNASRADTFGSWPTTMSEICKTINRLMYQLGDCKNVKTCFEVKKESLEINENEIKCRTCEYNQTFLSKSCYAQGLGNAIGRQPARHGEKHCDLQQTARTQTNMPIFCFMPHTYGWRAAWHTAVGDASTHVETSTKSRDVIRHQKDKSLRFLNNSKALTPLQLDAMYNRVHANEQLQTLVSCVKFLATTGLIGRLEYQTLNLGLKPIKDFEYQAKKPQKGPNHALEAVDPQPLLSGITSRRINNNMTLLPKEQKEALRTPCARQMATSLFNQAWKTNAANSYYIVLQNRSQVIFACSADWFNNKLAGSGRFSDFIQY